MFGGDDKIRWKQLDDALVIYLPDELPQWKVSGFKIEFRK